ncbi:MAG: hypothetical protein FWH40_04845 [Coriobacteriia bacterium]|nr:hypothetical protein [Coriobacteriia bacterium]
MAIYDGESRETVAQAIEETRAATLSLFKDKGQDVWDAGLLLGLGVALAQVEMYQGLIGLYGSPEAVAEANTMTGGEGLDGQA